MKVAVTVDHALCEGHGQCQDVAPEYFEVRDDNLSHLLREVDSAEGLARVQDAERRCPVDAITVVVSPDA
jgi:ferredoxin